jgi:hypothetical protein
MNRRKAIRVLGFSIMGLVLVTIALFAVSTYTLFSGLSGAISGGNLGLRMDRNNSTGDVALILNATPRNSAFLGTRLFVSLGLLDLSGKYIVINSTSVDIPPGGQTPFSLVLRVPYSDVLKYGINNEQGANVTFELLFGIRTLGDLVGFTQTLRIPAGDAKL